MQPYDFQLLSTPMTWDAAEAECERRNRKLASVHSIAENDYIAQLHRTDDGPSASSYSAGMCESSNGRPQPSRHALALTMTVAANRRRCLDRRAGRGRWHRRGRGRLVVGGWHRV